MAVARFATKRDRAACHSQCAFTLLELLIVIGLVTMLMVLVVPAFNSIGSASALTKAINDVTGVLELARAEAMATRSYVYVGFTNATNTDNNSELRIGALISVDGSSDTTASNLRPLWKLAKIASVRMTNYADLPQGVKSSADISLQEETDYVVNFPTTQYFKDKFGDTAFDDCPTVGMSPQGEVVHSSNPLVFFRTTTSIGLVPTRGTRMITTDGAIVSYYGGTGQLRVTRPK